MIDNSYSLLIVGLFIVLSIVFILYFNKKPKCMTEKYESGEIRYKYYIKYGKKVGNEKIYYRSGKLNKTRSYVNGMINGKCITYYESGNTYIESNYNDDVLSGEYKIYEENGTIKEIITY